MAKGFSLPGAYRMLQGTAGLNPQWLSTGMQVNLRLEKNCLSPEILALTKSKTAARLRERKS